MLFKNLVKRTYVISFALIIMSKVYQKLLFEYDKHLSVCNFICTFFSIELKNLIRLHSKVIKARLLEQITKGEM